MNYKFVAKYLKVHAGGDNKLNSESTWPGLNKLSSDNCVYLVCALFVH